MYTKRHFFTSESVSDGHPDKICDQVSDAVLDLLLKADPSARAGIECLCAKNFMVIAGETRGPEAIGSTEIEAVARNTIRSIGYDLNGFSWDTVNIDVRVQSQSPDIAQGVDAGARASEGAGDQGMMFGFACDETETLMPAAIDYANRIIREIATRRRNGELPGLLPDAKAQVTIEYDQYGPVRIDTILVSSHHQEQLTIQDVKALVHPAIIAALPENMLDERTRYLLNPTGRFVIGGPESDTGLTGRKIIVDTYGGAGLHGGGAFSGKDPTKVDRSAAYMGRYLAKNVVAAGLAKVCQIQFAYAIGIPEPVSVTVDTRGTAIIDEELIAHALLANVNLRPRGLIKHLGLDRPIYLRTAAFGHFGRQPDSDGGFSWEKTDLAERLKTDLL